MQRRAGDLLGRRYRLERPLAVGGTGAVWVGRHLALDVEVAIKFRAQRAAVLDAGEEGRFKREAQLAAQLKSPHVVSIYDFAVDAGEPYIVMELLAGEDLRTRLERLGPLPLTEVAQLLTQAARGLAGAHEIGIVHRDLKPANLFLAQIDAREVLKILDFGIANSHAVSEHDATAEGLVLGSLAHRSPEQVRCELLAGRSDLWALAVVAYQGLTGAQPFEGVNYLETLQRLATARFRPASELAPGLPKAADDFFAKAFAPAPEQRFQTAFELAHGFALLVGEQLEPFAKTRLSVATELARAGDATQHADAGGVPSSPRATLTTREGSGKRRSAPPLSGLPATATGRPWHNLPALLTRFVGRAQELAELRQRLASGRLVTLAGSGGAGKTRLALEVGVELLEAFYDGVWFVDLAALAADELVTPAVARALGVREEPGRPLEETLARALEARELLLILDNCEHVLTASAHFAEALLQRSSRLHILATSREPLTIVGECVWRLGPLGLPAPELEATPGSLSNCESAILFVERAVAVRSDFQITAQNAPVVANLCRRLDGIPLALELAAARLRALSVEQLAQRLEKRLDLLSGGSRTALPRHQTLRAALAWSHELLGPTARAVFRRLGVFRDGFTLEAAEAVCGADPVSSDAVIDALTELVDKSLITVDVGKTESRYRLLETLREYALDCLAESTEEAATRERFARYFLSYAEPTRLANIGRERAAGNARLHAEYANLRAVLEAQATQPKQLTFAVRMAIVLGPYWLDHWRLGECSLWTGQLLERLPADWSAAERGWLCYWRIANSHTSLRAQHELLVNALHLFRASGDERGVAFALNNLGFIAMNQGKTAEAAGFYEASLAASRALGNLGQNAIVLCNLGETACWSGASERGEALFREAIALHEQLGPSAYFSDALHNLGDQLLRRGELESARTSLREALQVALATNANYYVAKALLGLGRFLIARGTSQAALGIFAAAEQALEKMGAFLEIYARAPYEAASASAAATLPAAVCAEARALGLTMTLAQAAAYALAATALAEDESACRSVGAGV